MNAIAPPQQVCDPAAVKQTKLYLLRDALHECLRLAEHYAAAGQAFLAVDDDARALNSTRCFVDSARTAQKCAQEIKALHNNAEAPE
ncbi:hypothetical protein [Methylocapsa palsarum]|uniref:Uncharacterized protein n=1 Tax=Methylocapsa palsarum TaxID=1612308 RepID=A0A1I4CSX0_9HYPH|nr:hypothetical protein [Methylocapsa palsarum]SFK83389.1 hypothetical protein SAMN05444581_12715 [Methylocapsa palsarum]